MSLKDFVQLEERIRVLKKLKTDTVTLQITVNRNNAIIKRNDIKYKSETLDIAKMFRITEEDVKMLINENNKNEYNKLGHSVCSNWAASVKGNKDTIKQEIEYIHIENDEDDQLIIASQIMVNIKM